MAEVLAVVRRVVDQVAVSEIDALSGTVETQTVTIETVSSNVVSAVAAIESINGLIGTLSGSSSGGSSGGGGSSDSGGSSSDGSGSGSESGGDSGGLSGGSGSSSGMTEAEKAEINGKIETLQTEILKVSNHL